MSTGYQSTLFPGKKPNVLRELLNAGKPTLGTRVFSPWPLITEIAGNCKKFDYIEFLAEYAPLDQQDMENIARAAEVHNMGTIIKVDYANRAFVAQKAIASGFQAVLFADHRNAEEVNSSIKSVRADNPHDGGIAGYMPRRFIGYSLGVSPEQYSEMLRDIVCCFMVEKKEAVDNVEEICAVKGVDMIQFGPFDYAMNTGMNVADNAEELRKIEEKCIKTALKHGVRPRCEIFTPEQAKHYIELGVKDFNIGGDVWTLASAWAKDGGAMRDIMSSNNL